MAKMIDNKPSYSGEAKVWERFGEYLPNDVIAYNHREINGREYDFCLLVENSGVLIIEVKGWLANKIRVKGVDNIEVEGYGEPQTSPKKQARAYRFAMLNKINEKYNVSPLVLDMVCYPFVSKGEYYDSHLDIISEEPYTLFKEDLEDSVRLNQKIRNIFELNRHIPHADFSYDLMLRMRMNYEPGFMELNDVQKALPYSKLICILGMVDNPKCLDIVESYFNGIKNIVFVDQRDSYKKILDCLDSLLRKHNIGFKKNDLYVGYTPITSEEAEDSFRIFNFEIYYLPSLTDYCKQTMEIVEGSVTTDDKEVLKLLSTHSAFNYQQFEVEHATTEKDILVEAGAGTGKTFSMVSRVAYLCNKEIDPVMNIADEIAMVTFTNDAAINMKKRLKQMFVNYFVLTGRENYLKYVEDVDRAHISTIHKFAIEIMRGESLYTGLGTNYKIASDEYYRGKTYDYYLGEFLEEMEEMNPNFVNELPVPLYELKKRLIQIADKLLAKSVNFEQIKPSAMGTPTDNNLPYFNELLIKVVFPAESTYLDSMKNSNDMDLKASLVELGKVLDRGCNKLEELSLKYLFIDEFQDTDDVQIEILQKLQKLFSADCRLFVVGDLKQSIYRFRGAKLNAFQKLQNGKSIDWAHYRLNRNYRTDKRLLGLFDKVFENMGNMGLLPYTSDSDQLESNVITDAIDEELLIALPCHGKEMQVLLELLMNTIKIEKAKIETIMQSKSLSKEERTIAVLVRSNWQVDRVIKAANDTELNIEVSTGGDLFQLPSTLDLYKLILAITHSTSPIYLVNFIESNYTDIKLDYAKLHEMREEEKLNELNRVLNEFFLTRMGIDWFEVLNGVYSQPVLYALKQIFDALKPWEIYSRSSDKKKLYIANYEYLLERMIKFSRIDALTLNQVLSYLSINILTGQKQLSRSMEADDEGVHIICTTVHKSKGLEYGTIILPFTYEDMCNIKKTKLEASYNDNKLSYTVLFENDIRERNSNYLEDKEIEEQVAEESRILYVALTRAIRNCIWIKNIDSAPNTSWASLLEG